VYFCWQADGQESGTRITQSLFCFASTDGRVYVPLFAVPSEWCLALASIFPFKLLTFYSTLLPNLTGSSKQSSTKQIKARLEFS
jgi:hypothetical protein